MIGSRSTVIVTAASAVLFGAVAVGCKSNNGEVKSRTQDQDVRPDGTAVQTRTQVRETPSGETVKETQTQTRQPLGTSGSGTGAGGGSTGAGTSR